MFPWFAGPFFTPSTVRPAEFPASRGRAVPFGVFTLARSRLPTDSVGTMTLTLTNVAVGSRYRIEVASTGGLAEPSANAVGVAAASTVAITLNYYAAGNANNDLRIKIRKASAAPLYKPFETQASITAAAQSVYVAQEED